MGVAMYLIFSKLWKPTTNYRFILLISIFISYLLIGAYIFSLLNYPQEKLEILELLTFKNEFYLNHTCVQRSDLEELSSFIIETNNKGIYYYSINNSTDDGYIPKWKFGGETIFFVYTLLATIGYGHLAPYTAFGKLFCIIYIIIGVPITLLLLTSLTERFVLFIESKFLYYDLIDSDTNAAAVAASARVSNYNTFSDNQVNSVNNSEQENKKKFYRNLILYVKILFIFVAFLILIYILPAFILSKYTEARWSYLEAIYYCFISLTTIGLGDYVPGNYVSEAERDIYRFAMTFYLLVGILATTVVTSILTRIPLIDKISKLFSIRSQNNEIQTNSQNLNN